MKKIEKGARIESKQKTYPAGKVTPILYEILDVRGDELTIKQVGSVFTKHIKAADFKAGL